jgi:hypothetical protein
MRGDMVKKYCQKFVCCLLEKDCWLISLRGRLSRKAQRDLIRFISIESDVSNNIVYADVSIIGLSFIYYNISSCTKTT